MLASKEAALAQAPRLRKATAVDAWQANRIAALAAENAELRALLREAAAPGVRR